MARKDSVIAEEVPEEIDETLVTTAPDDWAFETIAEESAITIIMTKVGDALVGEFVGEEHIAPEPDAKKQFDEFDRYTFRGRDGRLYALNQSYKLRRAMDGVVPGQWLRITLVKFIPSDKGNDVKDYRVEVRTSA